MNLLRASHQWATRPADERFWDLSELYEATLGYKQSAQLSDISLGDVRVEAIDGEVALVSKRENKAHLTHWSFGQISSRANAPAEYLRRLPATLACQNINFGLKKVADERQADDPKLELLLHKNGGYYVRAITRAYERIWNADIVKRLFALEQDGWRTPPAYPHAARTGQAVTDSTAMIKNRLRHATAADAAVSLTIREGDLIGPAGLYASNEDMFAFMLNPNRVIKDGSRGGLMRGIMVWNSEVGKQTFGYCQFMFRGVCGNHIIWDAEDVKTVKVRHFGNVADKALSGIEVDVKKLMDSSASDDEAKIEASKRFVLKGRKKEDVIDFIFGKKLLTRAAAQEAYAAVIEDEDGPAYTAYGFAQGVTRFSQTTANVDARVELDRAAGKIMRVAF